MWQHFGLFFPNFDIRGVVKKNRFGPKSLRPPMRQFCFFGKARILWGGPPAPPPKPPSGAPTRTKKYLSAPFSNRHPDLKLKCCSIGAKIEIQTPMHT